MKIEDAPERLVESVAEGMWSLIRDVWEHDWAWCIKNDPTTADELRLRARHAIVRAAVPRGNELPAKLDLAFKKAFVEGS